jgi:hypothetical protein
VSGAIRRSHESKKRVRSATAFGQCNRNRLLRQSRVLFAHLTPGPLMGVDDLHTYPDRPNLADRGLMYQHTRPHPRRLRPSAARDPERSMALLHNGH